MISELFAKSQLTVLAHLSGFPDAPETRSRLVKALQLSFKTEDDASDFITRWLRESRKAPFEADIWQAGQELKMRVRPEGPDDPKGCDLCSQRPHHPGRLSLSTEGQGVSTPCICHGGKPELRQQALNRIDDWRRHPLGDPFAAPVTMAELEAKIKQLARSKSFPANKRAEKGVSA